ncbi:MAG: LLM class flavin-dependent oxidoreductase [Ilumatobacteraceae bacterium]
MTHSLSIGVQLPEVERRVQWPELIAMARTAEAVGFDSLWLGDHLLYDLPDGSARGPWEVWTSLAAIAASTDSILLGPLVASLGFHDPAMLAKMAATVDAISGGRLIVGVGAGWNEREYRAFGLPFDHRVDRFEEAFHVVRRLLAGEAVDHRGRYYALDHCVIDPPPARLGGPPLMVGSIGPRMLGITLPHVQMWNVWFSQYGNQPRGLARVVDSVHGHLRLAGRSPDDVAGTACVFVQTPRGVGRTMGDPEMSAPPLRGSASEIADQLRDLAIPGISHLQLVVDPIDQESIEWLADVLAELRR